MLGTFRDATGTLRPRPFFPVTFRDAPTLRLGFRNSVWAKSANPKLSPVVQSSGLDVPGSGGLIKAVPFVLSAKPSEYDAASSTPVTRLAGLRAAIVWRFEEGGVRDISERFPCAVRNSAFERPAKLLIDADVETRPADCKAEISLTLAVESAERDTELPDREPEPEASDSITPALAEALTDAETEDSTD